MKKLYTLALFSLLIFSSTLLLNAGTDSDPMEKLTPFLGKWKTMSIYQKDGLKAPGVLEYRWVLGKKWMFIEFVGQHPKRENWGAYAFFRYDKKRKCYISYDIFDEREPLFTTGHWLSKDTIRFEDKESKNKWGIDYTIKPDGAIYQENWVINKDGKRVITLKTYYTKIKK